MTKMDKEFRQAFANVAVIAHFLSHPEEFRKLMRETGDTYVSAVNALRPDKPREPRLPRSVYDEHVREVTSTDPGQDIAT